MSYEPNTPRIDPEQFQVPENPSEYKPPHTGGSKMAFSPNPSRKEDPGETIKRKAKMTKEGLTEYSEACSMHGMYYVFERNALWPSKIFWAIISAALGVLAAYWIIEAYDNWVENPVATNVRNTGLPVDQIEFPAITLCGLGLIEETLDRAFFKQVEEYVVMKTGQPLSNVENKTAEAILEEKELFDDFINDNYPGAVNKVPTKLAKFVASKNPENIIQSEMNLYGYDPCQDAQYSFEEESARKKRAATPSKCGEGQVHDSENGICYIWGGNGNMETMYTTCSSVEGGIPFFVNDLKQLNGLAALLTDATSSLKLNLGAIGLFYTSGERNEYDNYNFQLGGRYALSQLNITEVDVKDEDKQCMLLKYNPVTAKFEGYNEYCDIDHPVLCMAWAAETEAELNCTASGTSYSAPVTSTTDPESNCVLEEGETSWALDNVMDPQKITENAKTLARLRTSYKKAFKQMDLEASFPKLFELLWYSQIPCFDVEGFTSDSPGQRSLLKKCTWKGTDIPCSAIFKTFPTDRGMCCTFNLKAADDMFKDGTYKNTLKTMQTQDSNYSFGGSKVPQFYIDDQEPIPDTGIRNGLSVILDAHTDLVSTGSVGEDFQGFIATVSSPSEFPLTLDKHIRIRPGHDNLVAMTATNIITDSTIKSVDLDKRNCLFSDENDDMNMFKNYSQPNCQLECELTWARNELLSQFNTSCTPWYLPMPEENIKMCDPWSAVQFNTLLKKVPRNACTNCFPECQATLYSTVLTALPYRRCDNRNLGVSQLCDLQNSKLPNPPIFGAKIFEQYSSKCNNTIPAYVKEKFQSSNRKIKSGDDKEILGDIETEEYDAYKEDIASVHFYFEKPTLMQYGRKPSFTWISFFSQVGGLMGLCLGFSIASMVEIVYWGLFRFWISMKKRTEEQNNEHHGRRNRAE